MAIGLGRMFGFEFLENFNYPYTSRSIKEFWRRWHISLSTFFRDYVYIPLGGNRVNESRTYLNLLIVFFLTGFWHGANWSFLVWGLFHGFFMIVERLGFEKALDKVWKPIANIYTLIIVMFAWVLFRSNTLTYAVSYYKAMFNFQFTDEQYGIFVNYINPEFNSALVIALLGSFGVFKYIGKGIENSLLTNTSNMKIFSYCWHAISLVFYVSVFVLCSIYLTAGTYNPFIYYMF